MAYLLCALCLARHTRHPEAQAAPQPSDCFICQGVLERLPALADQAIGASAGMEWPSFCVQTRVSREMLVREEEVLDGEELSGAMAIKNQVNRLAIAYLEKKLRQPYAPDGAMQLQLDFTKNAGRSEPLPIFIFGRYLKDTREYCQHEWACPRCRGAGCQYCGYHKQLWPSIEASVRDVFAPAFGSPGGYLHCCGREDVDVKNTGGRPFVLELKAPKKRAADLEALAAEVERRHPLQLRSLRYCRSGWVESVTVSHFDKHYRAWVEAGRELGAADWEKLKYRLPLMLRQRTPVRVQERRADLIRNRRVYSIRPVSLQPKEWVLDIHAEAGTYIKELVHGDGGRTVPSLSGILDTPCRCRQLDVIGFDDLFLETLAV